MKRLYRQQHLVDFMAVVMQFTRIKIKWSFFSDEAPDLKRACWAFPLAGWLLGFNSGWSRTNINTHGFTHHSRLCNRNCILYLP